MKKISIAILAALMAFACAQKTERETDDEAVHNDAAVEENSGENISPQLEDSVDRFAVDSVSSAAGINEEKKDDLDDGKTDE